MFWINEGAYVKLWEAEDKGKYHALKLSTSEKDSKDNSKYTYSNWFGNAIGKAHQQLADGVITAGSTVRIKTGKIACPVYTKPDGSKASPTKITIIEFLVDDNKSGGSSKGSSSSKKSTAPSTAPASDVISDEDLPF